MRLEYDAVVLLFDDFWDEAGYPYGRADGDINAYTTGRVGKHNVVLVLLHRMGKASAAGAVASMRSSYSCLRLAILVGICGGVPQTQAGNEILLGDVIISESIVQYDLGRQYSNKFIRKDAVGDKLSMPNKEVRNLLTYLKTERGQDQFRLRTADLLKQLQANASQKKCGDRYLYPGTIEDKLFESSYEHKCHNSPLCGFTDCHGQCRLVHNQAPGPACYNLGCDERFLVPRERLGVKRNLEQYNTDKAQEPVIHIGSVASGDIVMKSGTDRDNISEKEGVIAFEMEGSGIWEEVPSIIVKGVCDYADSHKNKKWQNFAAATATAAMKSLLEALVDTERPQICLSSWALRIIRCTYFSP